MAIIAKPSLLESEIKRVSVPFRFGTIYSMLEYIEWPERLFDHTVVQVNGEIAEDWETICDFEADEMIIAITPHGGDDNGKIIGAVAAIAVAVVAPYAASAVLGGVTSGIGFTALTVGFSMVGMMAVSAMFPPPDQAIGDATGADDSQSFYLSGQSNQMVPYGVIPRVYGTHKIYPRTVGYPLMLPKGEDNYQTMLFDFGYGPLDIEDIRIGDTPLSSFSEARYIIHPEYKAGDPLIYYTKTIDNVALSFTLEPGIDETAQQGDKADTILIDFTIPQGLIRYDLTTGATYGAAIELKFEMREVGATTWQPFGDVVSGWKSYGPISLKPAGVTVIESEFDILLPKYTPATRSIARTTGASRQYYAIDPSFSWGFPVPPGGMVPVGTASTTQTVIIDSSTQGAPQVNETFQLSGNTYTITGVTLIANNGLWGNSPAYQLTHQVLPAIHPQMTNMDIYEYVPPAGGGGGTTPPDADDKFHYGFPNKWNTFETVTTLAVGQSVLILDELRTITAKNGNVYTIDADMQPHTQSFDSDLGATVPLPSVAYTSITGSDSIRFFGQEQNGFLATLELRVDPTKRYEFQVAKKTVANDGEVRDEIVWSGIRSLGAGLPVTPDGVHTLLEIEIKATDQLQGVLDKVSAVATSRLYQWNGSIWTFGPTRNPAWIYADILCGDANGRKVSRDKLDKDKLLAWAKECDQALPSGGNPQVYLLKSSVATTTTTATVLDTVKGQASPKNTSAIYINGYAYNVTNVVTRTTGSGFNEYDLTFAAMPAAMTVDGDFNTITIADAGRGTVQRSTCDLVVDFKSTVREILQIVAATGRATPTIRDGLYSVITESSAKYPVQMFTNRNASNIQATMLYLDMPEALRVKYIDDLTWIEEEVIIPNGSALTGNETKFEDLKLVGTTRRDQAIRYGRYYLAEANLRRESVTLDCDFEHLVATRGDVVTLATNVLKSGGTGRYVTEVTGNDIRIDEPLTAPGIDTIRHRDATGNLSILSATLVAGESMLYTLPAGHTVQKGDLVEFGTQETVKNNYLVQSIAPASNLSASLALVEHRPEILNAESGDLPPRTPLPGLQPGYQLGAVQGYDIHVGTAQQNNTLRFYVMLNWSAPKLGQAAHYQIFESLGDGQRRLIGTTDSTHYEVAVSSYVVDYADHVTYCVEPVGLRGERGQASSIKLLMQKGRDDVLPPSKVITFPVAFGDVPAIIAQEQDATEHAHAHILSKTTTKFDLQFTQDGHIAHVDAIWYAIGKE